MSEWINIKRIMPPCETYVLTFNGIILIGIYHLDCNLWAESSGIPIDNVTHWQPLPEWPTNDNDCY